MEFLEREILKQVREQMPELFECLYTNEREAELAVESLETRIRSRFENEEFSGIPDRIAMVREEFEGMVDRLPSDRSEEERLRLLLELYEKLGFGD